MYCGPVLVERVRATSVGKPDKWRKPYIDFCAATEAGYGSASFSDF